ncbi:MAG TPA: hypothetical protein VF077_08785 [Nitrospiraceae bacterium]
MPIWQLPRGLPKFNLVPLLMDQLGFNYKWRYSGAELDYTINAADITSATGTHILVTTNNIPLNGARRILLEAGLPRLRMQTSGAFSVNFFAIERDSAGTQTDYGSHAATSLAGTIEEKSVMVKQFVTPPQGAYIFTLQWNYNGTVTHFGTQSPAWLRVSVAG